jgi:hypothetical protein
VDGFVLILAIVVFSVFRNVVAETKKKQDRKLPDVLDSIAEHDEAQDRALEALRKWEARQRALQAGGGDSDSTGREPVRIARRGEHLTEVRLQHPRRRQQPAAGREPRPYELAQSQGAEQTRREAYDAIRSLLAGKADRPSLPVPTRTDPSAELAPSPGPPVVPNRIRERAPAVRPRIRGTVQRQVEPTDRISARPGTGRKSDSKPPAGLGRLESLPPVARGMLYAELLGKPVAFRRPGEGAGD